jgi:hypothetical protein
LGFFSGNLSRIAAIAVLANHVRNEPDIIDENACLLQYPTEGGDNKFLVIVDDLLKTEGCYLYYDKIEHEWRRSGKVSDWGFGDRHKDHWKNAKNNGSSTSTKQSKLYTEYPSKESNLVRLGVASGEICWKGYFEDLVLYCGIGFDRSRTVSGLIETDEGKGIFSWEKTVMDCLAGSTKLGDTMRDRQLCMVAYLFQLRICLVCLDSKRLVSFHLKRIISEWIRQILAVYTHQKTYTILYKQLEVRDASSG